MWHMLFSHSAQCHRQTDRQTDRRTDDIIKTKADHILCAVLSAKHTEIILEIINKYMLILQYLFIHKHRGSNWQHIIVLVVTAVIKYRLGHVVSATKLIHKSATRGIQQ